LLNATGYYSFDYIPYGNYELEIKKRGYKKQKVSDLTLSEDKLEIQQDFVLKKTPEEESQICLILYVTAAVILIVFFMFLYIYIRKSKPKNGKDLDNGNTDNKNQDENNQIKSQEPEDPPPSSPPSEN
jgi:cytoskeletal protein RodZ